MCGIIGIASQKQFSIKNDLLAGLKRLEYRGYDSVGYATNTGKIEKDIGQIGPFIEKVKGEANVAIAHTRWATHGGVSKLNSHPHADCKGNIIIVHNGIIENAEELKKNSVEQAIKSFFKDIKGTFAVLLIQKGSDKIYALKRESPLVPGIGKDKFYLASDIYSFSNKTNKAIFFEDEQYAIVDVGGYTFYNSKGQKIKKEIRTFEWSANEQQLKKYPHFMIKEIMEEPNVIEDAIRGRLMIEQGNVKLGGLESVQEKLREINDLFLIGCGTAHYACRVGEYMLEEYADMLSQSDVGSEFRYRKPIVNKNTAAVFISQSGETADTLACLREMKEKGSLCLGITNVVGSSQSRETNAGVYTRSGPEIAVASTKAFLGQLTILAMLTVYFGRQRNMSLVMGKRIVSELQKLPLLAKEILEQKEEIKRIAEKYNRYRDFFFIGRKYNAPIALEGALKLKEISYVHAEGVAGGELKHGPLALIDENCPTIAICPTDSVYEKMISNIEEIKARKGLVIAIATKGNEEIKKIADEVIYIPKTLEMLTPILSVIPLHLFAYYFADSLGCDVDKPKNLAKSVTVE